MILYGRAFFRHLFFCSYIVISAAVYETYSPEEAPYEKMQELEIDSDENKEYTEVHISHLGN